MTKRKSKIIWVDDEIDHLKPHILFLEERGYSVTPLTNAEDAISYIKKEYFDLILLDEMMPGLQGLEAVSILKNINPSVPIILITKSEEENLMEEAIGENIDDYLTKPVNPSQILSSCKRILEKKKIADEKLIRDYTQEFQRISSLLNESISYTDWIKIYTSLAERMIDVDNFPNPDLRQIIDEQLKECNTVFGNFIENNYAGWVKNRERPVLSPDIIDKYVIPLLKREQKVLFVLIDNLRVDQWMSIEPMLYEFFNIKREYYYSILPTATPYSRNSIFAGMFPYEIEKYYPKLWKLGDDDEYSQNRYEDKFLGEQLKKKGVHFDNVFKYVKIINQKKAKETAKKINEYLSVPLAVMVFNFVDILSHRSSDSEIIQEIIPDEAAYRSLTKTWLRHSPLFSILKTASKKNVRVIITSDHGSILTNRGSTVYADRETSTNLRYKYGKGIRGQKKDLIEVNDPNSFGLPKRGLNINYLIAKEDVCFLYPTNYHKFYTKYYNSFQHGGVSLQEMILPIVILENKK